MKKNNNIIHAIKKTLQKVHNKKCKSQTEWTAEFKKALYNLGKKKYKVYPDANKFEGEWLFDLCWADEGKNWRTEFKGLKLACEIEWSRNIDDILHDFQKLTVVNSEIRLMIIQYNNKKEFENFLEAIRNASEYAKSIKYNYLIAASGNYEDEIKIIEL